eukprot:m51a1_g5746 putative protein tyrosine kinase (1072) ;mRNA; f:1170442-1177724
MGECGWSSWALALLLARVASSGVTTHLIAEKTVYWYGGEGCPTCTTYNMSSSYACSNGIGAWMDGLKEFRDPLPDLPVNVLGLEALVTGVFNCDVYKEQSQLMLLLQRTAISDSVPLPDTGGCVCANCGTTVHIKADGWFEYNVGGINRLRAIPSFSFICLSSVTIRVEYEIMPAKLVHGKNDTITCPTPPSQAVGDKVVGIRYDDNDALLPVGPASALGAMDVNKFFYHLPTKLKRVVPDSTPPSQKQELSIYGDNIFECGAQALCRFTDVAHNKTVLENASIANVHNSYVFCTAPAWAADDSNSYRVLLDVSLNGQQFSDTLRFEYKKITVALSREEWMIIGACATAFIIILALIAAWLRHRHHMDGYQKLRDGNYEIDFNEVRTGPRIGKGTFGEVFKGTWRGAVIAIKKLPANQLSEVFLNEFLREITLMKSLRHPNVLQFLGSCLEPPNICIVIEYMGRGSLYSILHNPLEIWDWPMLLNTLCDASRGVLYLHTSRPPIIHRDLKTHNLLVDENWKVKVCDFGLSTIMEQASQTMTACGTPCWTAPEVLKHLHYTEKADVYSFGIVMWECLTRKDPYFGMPPFKVIFAVGNEGLRPPLPPFTPTEYMQLARDCWDESPHRRPSFEAILTRLEEMQTLGWCGDPTRPPQPCSGVGTPAQAVPQTGSRVSSDGKRTATPTPVCVHVSSPAIEVAAPAAQEREPQYVSPSDMMPVFSPPAPAAPVITPAALSPPVATLSTSRVLKFRHFSLCLEMGAVFARRFSEFEVMRAGLGAKCRREDDPSRNINSCFCSSGKRIVEVGISTKSSFGPTISADGQKITYTFDACKSNCSSSRDHHKSRLVLVVDDLPGCDPIFTTPFVLQAREKQRTPSSARKQSSPGGPDEASRVRESPPEEVAGHPDIGELITRGARALDLDAPATAAASAQSSGGAGAGAVLFAAAEAGALPPMLGNGLQTQLDQARLLSDSIMPRLMIRVHTVNVAPGEAEDVVSAVFMPKIERVPGYCEYKWRNLPGFLITFSTFRNVEGAQSSLEVARKFIKNESGYENPYHCDLAAESLCQLVSYCTNW